MTKKPKIRTKEGILHNTCPYLAKIDDYLKSLPNVPEEIYATLNLIRMINATLRDESGIDKADLYEKILYVLSGYAFDIQELFTSLQANPNIPLEDFLNFSLKFHNPHGKNYNINAVLRQIKLLPIEFRTNEKINEIIKLYL